jgi:hypothetical protein
VVTPVGLCAGVALSLFPARNGAAGDAEDFGQFDYVVNVFLPGRFATVQGGLEQVALGSGERFAGFDLFGQIGQVGPEKDCRLVGRQFNGPFLNVFGVVWLVCRWLVLGFAVE